MIQVSPISVVIQWLSFLFMNNHSIQWTTGHDVIVCTTVAWYSRGRGSIPGRDRSKSFRQEMTIPLLNDMQQ